MNNLSNEWQCQGCHCWYEGYIFLLKIPETKTTTKQTKKYCSLRCVKLYIQQLEKQEKQQLKRDD